MNELELVSFLAEEGVAILTIVIVYVLFVKPKDNHIAELVNTNSNMASDNSIQLGKIADTMEKISGEMQTLSSNQNDLKEGQNELWKEIVKIKGQGER